MAVISPFELVFDEHPGIGGDVLTQDVGSKWTDRLLLRLQLQIDPEGLSEQAEVLGPGEPRCEVRCLADPDVTQIDTVKATKR